ARRENVASHAVNGEPSVCQRGGIQFGTELRPDIGGYVWLGAAVDRQNWGFRGRKRPQKALWKAIEGNRRFQISARQSCFQRQRPAQAEADGGNTAVAAMMRLERAQ